MAYLGKGRREDLRLLALDLGFEGAEDLKVAQLKKLIIGSEEYDEEYTKNMLTTIIEEHVRREALADAELVERREEEKRARERALEEEKLARERAVEEERLAKEEERLAKEERLEKERAFELEKLRLQLEMQRSSQPALAPATSSAEPEQPKVDLKRILPKFDPKEDDMALYITLFERQLKFLKVPETTWVPYLIGSLPSEVGRMIVREPEEEYQDYQKVKDLLLKRFKLSADKFRQLFSSHRKNPTSTWRDFMFELNGYLDGWLTELNITTFDQLRNLVLTDQIKRRVPSEVKEHYLDSWPELNTPLELVEKLDAYDNIRLSNRKYLAPPVQKKPYPIKEEISRNALNKKPNNQLPKSEKPKAEKQERPALTCYGCGKPGYIKAQCPACSPLKERSHPTM